MAWEEQHKKSEKLRDLGRARAKEKGVPYAVALVEICREEPDLAKAAREETLGRRLEFKTMGSGGTMVVVDVAERVAEMAKTRAREMNVPLAVALCEVRREFPSLAHMAREQVLGRKV